MPAVVRALRGATTIDSDTTEQITVRVVELLGEMFARNDIEPDDLISIIFTATDDITAGFPAAAAREFGLLDVPLLGARELTVEDALGQCIRVLMHLQSTRERSEMRHVYLHGARVLRNDLDV